MPELKNYNKLKITELIERINIELVGAVYEGYQVTANKLLRYIDVIRAEIFDGKNLFTVRKMYLLAYNAIYD